MALECAPAHVPFDEELNKDLRLVSGTLDAVAGCCAVDALALVLDVVLGGETMLGATVGETAGVTSVTAVGGSAT